MFVRELTPAEIETVEAEVTRREGDHPPVRRDDLALTEHEQCRVCHVRSMAFGSRVAQGLEPVVTDPGTLARIGAIFDAPKAQAS